MQRCSLTVQGRAYARCPSSDPNACDGVATVIQQAVLRMARHCGQTSTCGMWMLLRSTKEGKTPLCTEAECVHIPLRFAGRRRVGRLGSGKSDVIEQLVHEGGGAMKNLGERIHNL